MSKKADVWLEARSLEDLVAHKDAMLNCSLGVDIDLCDIAMELAGECELPEEKIPDHWFEWCTTQLRQAFAGGKATIYRAISVDDIDVFLKDTASGQPVGPHWTWSRDCASTRLHGGEYRHHDLLLIAQVEESSVCWPTTYQQHFGHASEREVFVKGEVLLTSILNMETGENLAWQSKIVPA